MSLATNMLRSLYEDARRIALAPYHAVEEVQYTINGLREGKIPPKYVAWTIVSTAGAVFVAAALMFPIYWILTAALSPAGGSIYTTTGLNLLPTAPTLNNFIWVIGPITTPSNIVVNAPLVGELFSIPLPDAISRIYILNPEAFGVTESSDFLQFAENSAYISFWTVIAAMSVIIPGAYGMSRRDFIGRRKLLYLYVLLTQVGGGLGIAVLIALFALFNQMGWYNNKLALGIYYGAGAVPFNTWLLKTYMDGIPTSYEEAAIVDGAPSWRIVYEVIIPLSKAGLATVFVFVFLAGWTDYILAATLLDEGNYTLPVGLYSLIGQFQIPWARFSAFALTFATPLMLVYFLAQRYIESGLSFGGMEG
jgi:arabinogalactan oligomer/maltooligosaccharide transport system permease protein